MYEVTKIINNLYRHGDPLTLLFLSKYKHVMTREKAVKVTKERFKSAEQTFVQADSDPDQMYNVNNYYTRYRWLGDILDNLRHIATKYVVANTQYGFLPLKGTDGKFAVRDLQADLKRFKNKKHNQLKSLLRLVLSDKAQQKLASLTGNDTALQSELGLSRSSRSLMFTHLR